MKRDEFASLDNLIRLLDEWAEWCRNYAGRSGYPSQSAGFGHGSGVHSFDDLCDQMECVVMAAIDAAIGDLPPAQNAAINRRYLGSTFRFPRENYAEMLDGAHNKLLIVLPRKGVVL